MGLCPQVRGQDREAAASGTASPLLPIWQDCTPHPLPGWPEGHLLIKGADLGTTTQLNEAIKGFLGTAGSIFGCREGFLPSLELSLIFLAA